MYGFVMISVPRARYVSSPFGDSYHTYFIVVKTTLIDLASRPIHTPTARIVDRFARVRSLYSRGKQL